MEFVRFAVWPHHNKYLTPAASRNGERQAFNFFNLFFISRSGPYKYKKNRNLCPDP
jgi:hypothetical protein